MISRDPLYSPDDVELGTYRGPVHNNDIVEFVHVGTQRLLNRCEWHYIEM